jgi:tetratricopeptide (TPR) repeat protein
MNAIFKIIMICMLFSVAGFAQNATPQESATLQEAAKLHVQVVQLFKQNKFDDALPLARKVAEIREKELKDDDHLLSSAYLNLGHILRAKTKYDEAEKYFRRGLKVEEKRLGADNPQLFDILLNIGWLSHALGRTSEAELVFKQLVAIKEKQRGTEHVEFTNALQTLALFYQKMGKPDKSLPIYYRILSIKEKIYGEISNEVKESVEKCACALAQNTRVPGSPEVEKMWERARMIEGKLHPEYQNVSGGVLRGTATKKVQPPYPSAAKDSRVSGAVLVKVLISEGGKVLESKAICGADLLVPESEYAASQWEFSPVQLEGKPVQVQGILTFNFTLK